MSKIAKLKKSIKNPKDNCACYVYISCSAPDSNGKMEVELEYEGDETLAAFLIENAAQVFDSHRLQRESQ